MAGKHVAQISLELLSRFSLRQLNRIADALAFVIAHTPNRLSRITRANVCMCFGQLSKAEKKDLYRDSLRHTCRSFLELAAIWCWPVDDLLAICEEANVCEEFKTSTRGKIIVSPHLGSWEMLNLWLVAQGPTMSLYRARRKQPTLDRFMLSARSRNGATMVKTKAGGLRTLLKGLQKEEALMILPDQRPGRNKAQIDSVFFGYPVSTSSLLQSVASRQECDVFIAAAIRNQQGSGFQIYLEPMNSTQISSSPETSADYMNQSIEQWIQRFPEQYQWAYRRFTNDIYKENNCL